VKNDLLGELPEEKVNLIEKYRLEPCLMDGKVYWVRNFGNRPPNAYVTHRGMKKCPTLDLVFSFYGLCVAKMTYFRNNMGDYLPCKQNMVTGVMNECALWDMEFLVQRATGIRIDLRNLAEIKEIETFRSMCAWLERRLQERREQQDRYCRTSEAEASTMTVAPALRMAIVPIRRRSVPRRERELSL
jgi:hypothetical protein